MQFREICRQSHTLAFNSIPKVHYMQHFIELCELINPRFVQVYKEESHIGTMTQIWARSARGRYRRSAQCTVLTKRVVALVIRWEHDL